MDSAEYRLNASVLVFSGVETDKSKSGKSDPKSFQYEIVSLLY